MKVLIIEDTDVDILIADKIIKNVDSSIEVDAVESITDALDYLQSSEKKPDVILLDLILPIKDGFFFLDNIKDNSNLNSIPIYIYTSSIHFQDKERATSYHNVKGYIDKPINKSNVEDIKKLWG
ncbi:MAG: response regulator [bacterium]